MDMRRRYRLTRIAPLGVALFGCSAAPTAHDTAAASLAAEDAVDAPTTGVEAHRAATEKQAPVRGRVRVVRAETRVDGVSERTATQLINRRLGGVYGCYERALRRRPTLEGTVRIAWWIGDDGRPKEMVVTEDRVGDNEMNDCFASALGDAEVSVIARGGSVSVAFELIRRGGPPAPPPGPVWGTVAMTGPFRTTPEPSRSTMSTVLQAQREALKTCYDGVLRDDPDLGGTVLVEWTPANVAATRRVEDVTPGGAHPALLACVQSSLAGRTFPKAETPRQVTMGFRMRTGRSFHRNELLDVDTER